MNASQTYAVRYVRLLSERGRHVARVGVASASGAILEIPVRICGEQRYTLEFGGGAGPCLRDPEALIRALGQQPAHDDDAAQRAELTALLDKAGVFLAIKVELAHLSELYGAADYRDLMSFLEAA